MQALTGIRQFFDLRRESIILALMLEFLHGAIWLDFDSPLARPMMLIHLGLFLIWQPVWRGDQKLAWYNGLLFIVLTLTFVTWMNRWLMAGWLVLLIGFCGGRVVFNRPQRAVYMIMLLFLVSELLIRGAAMVFPVDIPRSAEESFAVLLPVLPIIVAFLPARGDGRFTSAVDPLHAISMSTLATLLILGSILNMYLSAEAYLDALLQTIIAIGAFLFVFSWLLTPRPGFSGLSQLWLRSVLNIGTPFEQWLTGLSDLFRQHESAESFLEAAMEELAGLQWIQGLEWTSAHSSGDVGSCRQHVTAFALPPLEVKVSTPNPLGGALYIHCKLLVQIINQFYVAKLQEAELTKRTHLQAIYETGARVTHDIKNILQSLQAIASVIVHDVSGESSVAQRLVRRQLPHLTQRLQLALDKLQTPTDTRPELVYLKDWWQDLKSRNNDPNVTFHADIVGDPVVPADLFDSVVENLLENVREKQQLEPDLKVTIALASAEDFVRLLVRDNGSQIPTERAGQLLREPLPSETGLGIGLYQAARQAEALGYLLQLRDNEDGNVCFELCGNAQAAESGAAKTA
jgi:signal transduction histidine kinase